MDNQECRDCIEKLGVDPDPDVCFDCLRSACELDTNQYPPSIPPRGKKAMLKDERSVIWT